MSRTCIGGCGRGFALLDLDLDFGEASLLLRLRFPAFLLGDNGELTAAGMSWFWYSALGVELGTKT